MGKHVISGNEWQLLGIIGMNRNYGNKRERVGIRRFDGRKGDKWDLLIMVGQHGNEWK